MNNQKIIKAGLIFIVVGIILSIGAMAIEKKSMYTILNSASYESQETIEYDKNSIKNIIINSDYSSIKLVENTNDKIEVIYSNYKNNKKNHTKVSQSNQDLMITSKNKANFQMVGVSFKTSDIIVKIPKGYLTSLKIDSDVGSTKIDNLGFTNLTIDGNVGSINLDDVIVKDKLSVNSEVGSVNIKNIKDVKDIKIYSEVGSINLKELYPETIDVKAQVGSINYKNDNKNHVFKAFNMESELGSQNVKVN